MTPLPSSGASSVSFMCTWQGAVAGRQVHMNEKLDAPLDGSGVTGAVAAV